MGIEVAIMSYAERLSSGGRDPVSCRSIRHRRKCCAGTMAARARSKTPRAVDDGAARQSRARVADLLSADVVTMRTGRLRRDGLGHMRTHRMTLPVVARTAGWSASDPSGYTRRLVQLAR